MNTQSIARYAGVVIALSMAAGPASAAIFMASPIPSSFAPPQPMYQPQPYQQPQYRPQPAPQPGTFYRHDGPTTFGSDGSIWQNLGNGVTAGPNGRFCTRTGDTTFCN
jgi:hypothetical protein